MKLLLLLLWGLPFFIMAQDNELIEFDLKNNTNRTLGPFIIETEITVDRTPSSPGLQSEQNILPVTSPTNIESFTTFPT